MKLENERLCAEISEMGAELVRLYDKRKGTEILWDGNPVFWKRRSPILFPNVGKTYRNTVRINGVQYPTTQHGFARDNEFRCILEKKEEAAFLFVSGDETKEVYPFDFELIIRYRLDGRSLHVGWEVKNVSDEEICFTIGGHPAFRFSGADDRKEDYLLKFPGKEKLEYILINPAEAAADPTKTYTLSLQDECAGVTEKMFEQDALIFDGGQIENVWLCHKDGTPYVGLECSGFPNFGIWSVKDAPFVCLEPWMGRCDDVGFDRELREKENVNLVEAGGKFEKSYTIVVA